MGLFSSEYKTTVGTTVSRTVEDKNIVASTKLGLISGLFNENENQLTEHVMESMIGSIGIKAERMYRYAKRSYPYGLPSSKVSSTADGHSVVFGVVKSLTNQLIEEEYYQFGPLNSLHAGWTTLYNNYGYDSQTNQIATLTSQIGFPVYLKDMVVVVKEATLTERANGSLNLLGTAACAGYTPQRPVASGRYTRTVLPTPIRVEPEVESDYVAVTYVWLNTTTKVVHEAGFSILLSSFDTGLDYFHVKYSDAGKDGYWLYQLGDGTYPEIDTIFDIVPTTEGQFFPVMYFRNGSVSMAANQQSVLYKTSNKMMKMIGIDYLPIIDAIHQNPSIGQVEQAMMMFAVPPNTTNPVEQRYLFDFFNKLYVAAGGAGVDPGWDTTAPESSGGSSSVASRSISKILRRLSGRAAGKIRIEIADAAFNKALSCEGIFKRKKTGVIAAVGAYASSFTTEMVTNTYTKKVAFDIGGHDGGVEYRDVEHTYQVPMDVFIYKHQITDAVYEEVIVYDLKMTYYMWGGYSTVGDNLDAILLVPLDHAITRTYSIPDREILYARSLHYVFNSRTVTKVKWYQQGWFADLIKIVGIVLTVISLGADGGFFASLGAAIADGVEALVMFIAMAIVEVVVMGELLKLFVKAVGGEFAMLLAVVFAAYAAYTGFQAGSIKGAPWADKLLTLANGLTSAVSASTADAMNGLKKEADQFNLLMKDKADLLDKANKLLDTSPILSPFVIFGESPNDFYNRTVHSGNIGILGIDSITSYVDIALTLPKINDTLEGNNYVFS